MRKQLLIVIAIILGVPAIIFIFMALLPNVIPSNSKSAQAASTNLLNPKISAIDPSSDFNDLDTPLVITGTDFTAVLLGTDVLTSPTAYLGTTALLDVSWITNTILTATVPWGMDPGIYPLTVTNPDGGTGSLSNAFTVNQGIGQWNGGNMFGGRIKQVLLKPGDPNTVYALGEEVGLFRSRDAGETWRFITDEVIGHADFVIDPNRPSRIYSVRGKLYRSDDEGDTWYMVLGLWPDGSEVGDGQIFVSPHNDQLLFLSSAIMPDGSTNALGLSKSMDDGDSWVIIDDMTGISVRTLDFNPDNPQEMVLGTSDGRVFQSTDGGDHWNPVAKPSVDDIGVITYNPFVSSEVWIAGSWMTGSTGIFKSVDNMTTWDNAASVNAPTADSIDFSSATSVYLAVHYAGGWHSDDDGQTWQPFGPPKGGYDIAFNLSDPNLFYMGGYQVGFHKSTDGGQTWEVKNQGLSALIAYWIEASLTDRTRVYAVIDGWQGVFRSKDSAASWEFIPVQDAWNIWRIKVDPFDSQHLYLTADTGFYTSTDGGTSWVLDDETHHFMAVRPDPFHQGRLLASGKPRLVPSSTSLYVSTNSGQTWDEVAVAPGLTIKDIAFDSLHPGVVYLTTDGSWVYRSHDYGSTWEQIASEYPGMKLSFSIAIATHPQPMVIVDGQFSLFRSLDGGDTWAELGCGAGTIFSAGVVGQSLFVDGDSQRLYAATFERLYMSSDGGDTCEPASGVLGQLRTTALSYSGSGDQTILYAATTGGDPDAPKKNGNSASHATQPHPGPLEQLGFRLNNFFFHVFMPLVLRQPEMPSDLLNAGIYRFVNH